MNLDLPRETLIRYVWGARELRRKAGLFILRARTQRKPSTALARTLYSRTHRTRAPTQSLA